MDKTKIGKMLKTVGVVREREREREVAKNRAFYL